MNLSAYLALAMVQITGVASPGPDFNLVCQRSLIGSRTIGLYSAAGIATAIWFHILLNMLGLAYLIHTWPSTLVLLKLLGAGYLLYMGINSVRSGLQGVVGTQQKLTKALPQTKWAAFREGVLTNLLNPKCAIFIMSTLAPLQSKTTTWLDIPATALLISAITWAWFSLVALFFSQPKIQAQFQRHAAKIELGGGVVFCFFGLAVFYSIF